MSNHIKLFMYMHFFHVTLFRWTKNHDMFAMDKIFFPINIKNSHWVLAVAFVSSKRIQYFDSLAASGDKKQEIYLNAIQSWLSDESKSRNGVDINPSEWRIVKSSHRNTPQQKNGVDCGIFSVMFADVISDDIDPSRLTQSDMPHFRKKVCCDILRGQLRHYNE